MKLSHHIKFSFHPWLKFFKVLDILKSWVLRGFRYGVNPGRRKKWVN